MSTEEARSYEDVLTAIRSLAAMCSVPAEYKTQVPTMVNWLNRMGYEVSDLAKLNIIHVTGTKGKGSTSTICESILRSHGFKTGTFISPHLLSFRERILLNGRAIPEEIFSHHFWKLHDNIMKLKDENEDMPRFFTFMTLLAFDVFLNHDVDAVVLEVGIGGELDATNVIDAPVVCGVTSIHLDHMDKLGDTVESIAWHKSGIFKAGAPAVTLPQRDEVMSVLQSRATEKGVRLHVAPPLDSYEAGQPIKIGLSGEVHEYNASLALQLSHIWMAKRNQGIGRSLQEQLDKIQRGFVLTEADLKGLSAASRPGRTQIVSRPHVTYFLDTAHTDISIEAYADWFLTETRKEKEKIRGRVVQILIFKYAQWRDVTNPLSILKKIPYDIVLFSPHKEEDGGKLVERLKVEDYEKQVTEAIDAKRIWDELKKADEVRKGEYKKYGSDMKNSATSNNHLPGKTLAISAVIPLRQALILATFGKDNIRGAEASTIQQLNDMFPEITEIVRSAEHIQIMIVGSHTIVAHSVALIGADISI